MVPRAQNACGAQNFQRPKMQSKQMSQAVIDLHDIARLLEGTVGQGSLSEDIRKCADRLHELTSPFKAKEDVV
jgi:hypothetical protein